MFSLLLPKEPKFFDFFDQHASLIVQSAHSLDSIEKSAKSIPHVVEEIKNFERQADEITHQTIDGIRMSFITPIEREEIYRLICCMDDVLDHIEGAADCLTIYKISSMLAPASQMINILVKCTEELQVAVKGLRQMGKGSTIRDCCININHLESEGDAIHRQAVALLFSEEQDIRSLIKWKEIYEHLEESIDRCEDAANIIEGIILEYS
jgi:predicted phosphate transport protein (TIGR00153 family)